MTDKGDLYIIELKDKIKVGCSKNVKNDKCELVVPGTDEDLVRQAVFLTGQYKFLKAKVQ